ncbi:MAG: protein kinase [Opitutaceae bacterium]|nr:protein kinase [Opitutaceae bacterium]
MTPSIPDYELLRLIGRGSYGDVWLARGVTGIFRAVKIVWRDRFEDADPFEREFKGMKEFAAISLSEAHQLALLHIGRSADGAFFYYVMELADDAASDRAIDPVRYVPLTLKEVRARRGRLPAAECLAHGVALAQGLAELHGRGLVHRDIKPSNVVIVEGRAKLADIGLVASVSDASTYVGTQGFVPPEGPGAPSADVFALGKVLYELSTGLDRNDFPRLPAGLREFPDSRALLELNEILLRACDPDPGKRYPEAKVLLADLALLQGGRSLRRRRRVGQVMRIAAIIAAAAGLALGGAWYLHFREDATAAVGGHARDPKAIAVLPFSNLSPDPANAFFADGMHDELTTQLGRIRDLRVIARGSTLAYPPGQRDLRRIGRDLGVGSLLEGSVRREGERVRVSVALVDARNGASLWTRSYERALADAFALQTALAREIAGELRATLTASERAQLERPRTSDQVAYDLYLRARASGQRGFIERDPFDRAVELYEQAVARDPGFVQAYVQLALMHGTLYWYGHFDPTPARLARLKAAVDAAVRLAPDLPETRLALGSYYYRGPRELPKALVEFQAAAAGLPNDAQLRTFIGAIARRRYDWPESAAQFGQAVALDPVDRTGAAEYVLTLLFMRRYAELIDFADRYVAQYPDNRSIIRNASRARYELDGDRAAYLHRYTVMPLQQADKFGLDAAADLAFLRGDFAEADRILRDPRITFIPSPGSVVSDPVALQRALLAWLTNRPDDARALADDALRHYATREWSPRQKPSVLVATAQAHACAGRADDAVRAAQEAWALLQGKDSFHEAEERPRIGHVYALLNRRDEALGFLRDMMAGPCRMTAREVRHDPVWSRLKDDPRFEETLRSAKKL